MAADGSVVFEINLNDKEAQKELTRLKGEMLKLQRETNIKRLEKSRLEEELSAAREAAESAKTKLEELKAERDRLNAGEGMGPEEFLARPQKIEEINAEITEQEKAVRELDRAFDSAAKAVDKVDAKIKENADAMTVITREAAVYADQLSRTVPPAERVAEATEEASEAAKEMGRSWRDTGDTASAAIGKLEKRLLGLAKRVFVFSLLTSALRSMRTWMGNAIKSNNEASAAIARLQGALLTLAQPILSVVIPAFIALVNALTKVMSVIASLFSMLMGKTIDQSIDAAKKFDNESKSITGVGNAAKKASKSLASFDEINKLSSDTAGGASGGGEEKTGPMFDFEQFSTEVLEKIAELVKWIGAGLAAWKIGSALGLNLKQMIALMVAIKAIIEFIQTIFDMWQNGITFDKLKKAIAALAIAAAALWVALGPVAAGIALVVGGLALLATGFRDAMKNGLTLENTLTMIAGLLATGLGFSIIACSFIPLFIAAIVSAGLALVYFTGHGEELMAALQKVFDGFREFISGVFAKDWEKAFHGLQKMGEGFREAWEVIVQSIKDAWNSFVQWFDEKTNGKFRFIIGAIEKFVIGMADSFERTFNGITEFISGVFSQDWGTAWNGVKNILIGVANGMITQVETLMNIIISGINLLTSFINSDLKWNVPDWVPGIGGQTLSPNIPQIKTISLPRIPALAAGAVIPPNREFLAVLGDQSSGNNIEAPEALLRQMAQEAASLNTDVLQAILLAVREGQVLSLNGQVFGKVVKDAYNSESKRAGMTFVKVT